MMTPIRWRWLGFCLCLRLAADVSVTLVRTGLMLLYTPYGVAMGAGGAGAIRADSVASGARRRVAWDAGRRVQVILVRTRQTRSPLPAGALNAVSVAALQVSDTLMCITQCLGVAEGGPSAPRDDSTDRVGLQGPP